MSVSSDTILKIKDLYLSGKTSDQVASDVNISKRSVLKYLKTLNIQGRRRKYIVDEYYFEKIDSDKKAYLLGFLFADGCVRYKNGIYGLKLKVNKKDIHIIDYLQAELKSNYPVVNESGTDCVSVTISSKKLSSDLIKLGCVVNKTLVLMYPNIDKKYWNPFIHGYFDGDGNIYYLNNGRIQRQFKLLGTLKFLERVKLYFEELGIICYDVIKYDISNVYQLRVCRKESLRIIYDIFYNKGKYIFLDRKRQTFINAIN